MRNVDVFINGKKVKTTEAATPFHTANRLLAFESIKSYRGSPFQLGEHLSRLVDSARTIGLTLAKSERELGAEVRNILKSYPKKDKFLRLSVDKDASYVFVLDRKRAARIYQKGVKLQTAVTRRHLVHAEPAQAKTNAFFNSVLATLDRAGTDAFEAVFLDVDGYLIEAAIWNIFTVKNGGVLTPGVGILNGVTRAFVLKCAHLENLPVSETTLTRHDIWNADEAFLTNTSGEIVPIRLLDGRKIGNKIPGAITERLKRRFEQEVEKELHS
jgi:branched-chain amino acid aminotransferase